MFGSVSGDASDTSSSAETTAAETPESNETSGESTPAGFMSYAEYDAAAVGDTVVIEAYFQAIHSWQDDKITVSLADRDGAYSVSKMACTEEEKAALFLGRKIRVTGCKNISDGEAVIEDGTFEFIDSTDEYTKEPLDGAED